MEAQPIASPIFVNNADEPYWQKIGDFGLIMRRFALFVDNHIALGSRIVDKGCGPDALEDGAARVAKREGGRLLATTAEPAAGGRQEERP